jgi:integrase
MDETGKRRWGTGFRDRAQSLALAQKKDDECKAIREGLISSDLVKSRTARTQAIREHLNRWGQVIVARGAAVKHSQNQIAAVSRLFLLSRIETLANLSADSIQCGLAELRKTKSARTANYSRAAVLGFLNWAWDASLILDLPRGLQKIRPYPPESDRRRVRGVLTWAEIKNLVAVVAQRGRRMCTARTLLGNRSQAQQWLTGSDRAMVYQLAMATGFRAGEIRALTRPDFMLDHTEGPLIRLPASASKRGKRSGLDDLQPLPQDLAAVLEIYLTKKPPTGPIWYLPERTARMLQEDLKLAGLPIVDQAGGVLDFHALRHSFITHLVSSGLPVKQVQMLARHSKITLTMDRYTHLDSDSVNEAGRKVLEGPK